MPGPGQSAYFHSINLIGRMSMIQEPFYLFLKATCEDTETIAVWRGSVVCFACCRVREILTTDVLRHENTQLVTLASVVVNLADPEATNAFDVPTFVQEKEADFPS